MSPLPAVERGLLFMALLVFLCLSKLIPNAGAVIRKTQGVRAAAGMGEQVSKAAERSAVLPGGLSMPAA